MLKKFLLIFSGLVSIISCQENFDNRLKREAILYTQQHCPYKVDQETTLDSTTYSIENRNFTRWYTIGGNIDTPLHRKAVSRNIALIKHELNTELRGDTKWETCKEHQINFTYIYRSESTGEIILKISIAPQDYSSKLPL